MISTDCIVIVRHGKPALSRKVRMDWRGYRDWWVRYDAGGLVPDQKVPDKIKDWAAKADILISSSLRRAIESVRLASGRDPDLVLEDLREAALPSPKLGPLKFRPKTWGTWSRIVWYWGWPDGMESHSAARTRSRAVTRELSDLAKDGKTLYVSGHGWFNRMMKSDLKALGWTLKSQNGDLHWSHRVYTRPTIYTDPGANS